MSKYELYNIYVSCTMKNIDIVLIITVREYQQTNITKVRIKYDLHNIYWHDTWSKLVVEYNMSVNLYRAWCW